MLNESLSSGLKQPEQPSIIGAYAQASMEAFTANALYRYWEHAATHDVMTGTLNRVGVMTKLESRITQGEAGRPFGILFIDLDKFKAINDNISHNEGDNVLRDLGEHLSRNFRRAGETVLYHDREKELGELKESQRDSTHEDNADDGYYDEDEVPIGRIGGDEFIVIVNLDATDQRASTVEERMESIVKYARDTMNEFVASRSEAVRALGFNCSMGESIWTPHFVTSVEKEASRLLKEADDRMYQDKRARGQSR